MRNTRQIILVGTNGTGKSTFSENIIKYSNKRSLIITKHLNDKQWANVDTIDITNTNEIHNFTGVRRSFIKPAEFKYLLNFHSGNLILDDARRFVKANLDDLIDELQMSRRQLMVDIIVAGHSFMKIPPGFFDYSTHFVIFKTIVTAKKRSDTLSNIEKVLEVEKRVNEKAIKNPHHYEIITL